MPIIFNEALPRYFGFIGGVVVSTKRYHATLVSTKRYHVTWFQRAFHANNIPLVSMRFWLL
jgi:hypothetical protein